MKPKLISLATEIREGAIYLYALDDQGNTWYNGANNKWIKLDLEFDSGPEPVEKKD